LQTSTSTPPMTCERSNPGDSHRDERESPAPIPKEGRSVEKAGDVGRGRVREPENDRRVSVGAKVGRRAAIWPCSPSPVTAGERSAKGRKPILSHRTSKPREPDR
jgi:hypothetical protein